MATLARPIELSWRLGYPLRRLASGISFTATRLWGAGSTTAMRAPLAARSPKPSPRANLKPRMQDDEVACLERLVRSSNSVLEYGCGGSTVFMSSQGHCQISTIESDPAWLSKVESEPLVQDAVANGRVVLCHAYVGPTGPWGAPSDDSCKHLWPRYSELPWARRSDYDLILIDGRFRVACALQAVLRASTRTLIVVHDFWNRPKYHVVLPFLEWKESCQSTGVFTKRRDADAAAAQALLDNYRYNPD
jgi:hypothetical protein